MRVTARANASRRTSGSPLTSHLLFVVCLGACLLGGCGVPGADEPVGTFELDFSLPAGAERTGAVVFMVDGLNAGIFGEMLEAGELPAIRKYFVDRGLYAPRAVANTPSVTLANETSLVTGLFPGHHGITGVNWFDRNTLIWRNYETIAQKNTLDGDYTARNIYEHFADRTTVSIFFQPHRGTTKFIENWTSAGPPFFFGWYDFVDRLTLSRFDLLMEIARKRGEFPAVTIAYLLAPDFQAYAHGVSSEQYREAIRHTDRQIGRVLADMDRAGLLEKIQIALVSDHSLMDVTKHAPLAGPLRKLGLRVAEGRLWENTPFEKRQKYYRDYDCVLYGGGDRYWAVQVRRRARAGDAVTTAAGWHERPSAADLRDYPVNVRAGDGKGLPPHTVSAIDLVATLAGWEGVDAVAYSVGPNRVRVRRRDGEVEFRQAGGRGAKISCHLVAGKDPLGWKAAVPADVLAGTRALTPREWLETTHATDYPDLAPQIVAYFRARRAGDIAVFAAEGYDFGTKNRAGHGGLRPGDMHVPFLLAGPGVPAGRVDAMRTADIVPTLLKLLGRPIPDGLDGRALPNVRHVASPVPATRPAEEQAGRGKKTTEAQRAQR